MYNLECNTNKTTQSFIINYWINNKISDCSKNVRTSKTQNKKNKSTKKNKTNTNKKK